MYEELVSLLKESQSIVFFGGAGVSTESGIPDFRSENGLYKARLEYGLSPEELIEHGYFFRHPKTFFDYYKKNLIAEDALPNDAHKALARLEQMGKLKAVITQNIDGLHQLAGSKKVYELHGSVQRNTCLQCGRHFDLSYIMDPAHCEDGVPCCPCGGMIKPDVVLYGEGLDEPTVEAAVSAIEEADLLIVGGTSLVVYPAAGLLRYFRGKHLVLINLTPTPSDGMADLIIREPIGKVLGACVSAL
ncbi:MAG: NAD-dependent protein deacylase [Firmicutes bacterium]|nr:NAD-dependent protein deacylase [Bacillota bacterium]